MPKRVIDFDAVWASDKLSHCAPWARAEYTWIYGLADSNGSFELTNLRVIFGRAYAIRDDVTIQHLSRALEEFQAKGLLFVWEENGQKYGHWTGSDLPGRLPPPSWRARLEKLAPPVPQGALANYLSSFSSSRLKAVPGKAQGQDLDLGLDLGLGLDLDLEVDAAAAPPRANVSENENQKSKPPVNGPGGAFVFDHPRVRISSLLDSKLALEFPELPEPVRRAEYVRMAAKLEEAGESARSPGNYARAWLRGLGSSSAVAKPLPVQRDLWAGTALRPAACGVCVKPAVLERIRARDAASSGQASEGVRAGLHSEPKERAS